MINASWTFVSLQSPLSTIYLARLIKIDSNCLATHLLSENFCKSFIIMDRENGLQIVIRSFLEPSPSFTEWHPEQSVLPEQPQTMNVSWSLPALEIFHLPNSFMSSRLSGIFKSAVSGRKRAGVAPTTQRRAMRRKGAFSDMTLMETW